MHIKKSNSSATKTLGNKKMQIEGHWSGKRLFPVMHHMLLEKNVVQDFALASILDAFSFRIFWDF